MPFLNEEFGVIGNELLEESNEALFIILLSDGVYSLDNQLAQNLLYTIHLPVNDMIFSLDNKTLNYLQNEDMV